MNFKVDKIIKDNKDLIYIAIIYFVLTLIFFFPLYSNLSNMAYGNGADLYQTLFFLWYVPHALFSNNIYFTHLLFFPIGSSLVTQTLSPLAGILFSFLDFNITLKYNILFIIAFILTGTFSYMLAFYITKDKYASILASFIFTFAPTHMAQAFNHLDWTMIEFIPLYFYFLLRLYNERKSIYAVYAGISLFFASFFGDIEQGIFLIFFTLVILILFIFEDRKEKKYIIKNIYNSALLLGVSFVIAIPFIIEALPYLGNALSTASSVGNSINDNIIWSDNLLSFFLPSIYNYILHYVAENYSYIYYNDPAETTSYIGYITLILVIVSIYYWRKDNNKEIKDYILLFSILSIISFLLSLGPYIVIGKTITIPSLYILYKLLPIFNIIREPGRFDIFTMLFLSIIAAFGYIKIRDRINSKNEILLLLWILAVIAIEYVGLPITNFSNELLESTYIPKGIYQLGNLSGNFTVMFIPIIPTPTQNAELYPGIAMYYDTALHKPIVGGYIERTNITQNLSVINMPLAIMAYNLLLEQYTNQTPNIEYSSPVLENYTDLMLYTLALYNVSFIVVIKNAYGYAYQYAILSYLNQVFGLPVYSSNNITIFYTAPTLNKDALMYINKTEAIAEGAWITGYALCNQNNISCNATIESLWYADYNSVAKPYISIYAPITANYTLNFTGLTLPYNTSVYISTYAITQLGLERTGLYNLSLENRLNVYSKNITLEKGINYLYIEPESGIIMLKNMTIEAK